jgi:hypothetical protein
MIKPITPAEVKKLRVRSIPPGVFEVVNELITSKYVVSSERAYFTQDELVLNLVAACGYSRQEIYDNNWLDFEPSYREAGWKVEYDKPAYNESGPASFTFFIT